jgi:hypothetical protein
MEQPKRSITPTNPPTSLPGEGQFVGLGWAGYFPGSRPTKDEAWTRLNADDAQTRVDGGLGPNEKGCV